MSQTRLLRNTEAHKVTTLELFFDLVFVYGISQVTAYLAYDHSRLGFARGLLLAALLWWAWVAYSWIGTSVRVSDRLVQGAMFVAMAAIMVLALLMPDFFDDDRGASLAMLAAAAYVVVRLMHLVLFFVAGRGDPGITRAVLSLARTVVVAAVLLLSGAYLGGAWQMALVAVAVVIDVIGPYLGRGEGWRLALGHFAERHALIVIIALGESIVAIGVGASDVAFTAPLLALSLVGVALACAFWVAYFTGTDAALEHAVARREGVAQVTTARDVYSVMHFLLVAGLILVALAMKSALKGSEQGWTEPLAFYAALALGVGVLQFLSGLWAMRLRAGAPTRWAEPALAAGALVLIPVGLAAPALVSLLLAVVLVGAWRVVRA